MVATRHHPTEFPPPALTPSQSPSPATSQTLSSSNDATSPSATQRSVRKANVSARATSDTEDQIRDGWLHTPSNLTLLWLAISLPLVLWDCGFLLLRPWTLPGGSIHSPIWIPYKLYGEVDWTYSVAAWHEGDGFGHAQATLNVIETLGYLAYLWVVFIYGMESGSGKLQKIKGRGAPTGLMKYAPQLAKARVVRGHHGAMAVIGGFGVSAITISKTVLYCLNELMSSSSKLSSLKFMELLFLFILPNGAWIIFPTYMLFVFGREMYEGMTIASTMKSRAARKIQ